VQKRSLVLGCLLAGVLLLILLAAGGAWWYFRGEFTTADVPPASPVQVTLLSPVSGDEVAAGDFVHVGLQALAPEAIVWSEVFVDGVSLGALTESAEHASWTWQAWPAGIHVLSGRAQTTDGQLGVSQTVIVNVLALTDVFQASAAAGQTLEDVGAKFGLPAVQIASANPKLDPSKPLGDGQPVNIPTGGGKAGGAQPPAGGGNAPGAGGAPFLIKWELKLTGQVDKSYCYVSDGSGTWDKMPKQPFQFFGGLDNLYTQVFDVTPPSEVTVQAQCWGWLGGVLKYLGQGEAKSASKDPIQLNGDGFQLVGTPNWPDGNELQADVFGPQVPAPYALRKTTDPTECFSHKGNLSLCKEVIGNPSVSDFILVWEWIPGTQWPGAQIWLNDIKGYRVYEIDPLTKAEKFMKYVSPAARKIALLPLQWGPRCYGVQALHTSFQYGVLTSAMDIYCPGTEPPTEKVVLKPVQWMTTGGSWVASEGCTLGPYQPPDGFGYPEPKIAVGSWVRDDGGCYEESEWAGGIKFLPPVMPPGSVVHYAYLSFSKTFLDFGASGWQSPAKPQNCVATLGTGSKDWTGIINPVHFADSPSLISFYKPLTPVSQYSSSGIDVTWVVYDWVTNPMSNHGFIFRPVSPPQPIGGGTGRCVSGLGNFQLVIYYFSP
jgi:LysM repeat protein